MTKESKKKYKVAVYGSLRLDEYNFQAHKMDTQSYLGTFETEPVYSLYSVGSFPALKKGGVTSVTMDVFEVDQETYEAINRLEGFFSEGDPNNMYNRESIHTPYGKADYFIYNDTVAGLIFVESGDWSNYLETTQAREKCYSC